MTPEQQRVAIGEADGWTWHGDASWPKQPSDCYWKKGRLNYQILPKYLNDLNAMHEVEKVLTGVDTKTLYLDILYLNVCDVAKERWEREWFSVIATASQRAEAFLRTIGKWEEAK